MHATPLYIAARMRNRQASCSCGRLLLPGFLFPPTLILSFSVLSVWHMCTMLQISKYKRGVLNHSRPTPALWAHTHCTQAITHKSTVPHTQAITHASTAPRTQAITHVSTVPHTQAITRTSTVPHTQAIARTSTVPHTQAITHASTVPHTQAITRTSTAPDTRYTVPERTYHAVPRAPSLRPLTLSQHPLCP